MTSPREVFGLNFTRNLPIAELCIKHRKRLIQYSTPDVYGKAGAAESFLYLSMLAAQLLRLRAFDTADIDPPLGELRDG